jgi:uncharacterized membrane protein AbrB (regulator of aidB expression)
VIPVAITLAGFSATEDYRPVTVPFDAAGLAILLGAGGDGRLRRAPVGAPTAFTLGPLFLTIAVTLGGMQLSSVPTPLTNAAQVLLGCSLGARFDRGFLTSAPRLALAMIPALATMLVLANARWGGSYPWAAGITSAAPSCRRPPGAWPRCRSPPRS